MQTSRAVTVELCLRSSAPSVARGRQESVYERVEALAGEENVEETTVTYWSTRVCVPGTDAGGLPDSCPRVVGEIRDTADEHDVSIEPYFRTRPASHDVDEQVVFLPVICLLVHRDGALCGIYPVTDSGERYTVEDGLSRLEAGRPAANLE